MTDLYNTAHYLAPELLLEFEIDAEKARVYKAWTELETFKKWFLPTGFSIAKAELVPEKGGYFTVHMRSPEGEIYPTRGEYLLLEAPDRIVYKDSWDDDRENNAAITTEIRFEAVGAKTRIELYSSFATPAQKEETLKSGVADGWKMFFNNLNAVLKEG